MLLYQTLVFTIHGKKLCKKNKLKVSAPIWNEQFELPDGSYSEWDIPDFLEYS